jgi:tetratricopeptide (TPR) repeat protein
MLVIARNSSFTYKGEAVDIRRVGRELNVGYVLEGSVRRSQDRLRITAQLIETQAGTHIWADRFDGNFSDVFELQDRIAETTAAVIEPKLRYAEADRVRRRPPQSLDAYELWLRAISYAGEFTPESMASAMECCDRSIALDPTFTLPMASAAYYHGHCNLQGWVEKPDKRRAKSIRLAYDAVEIAKDDSNVLWQAAFAIWSLEQNLPRSLEWFRRSLSVNPNNAMALAMAGWVEAASGDPVRGRELLERSQRLNPRHPRGWFVWAGMAVANIIDAKYEDAIAWAEKALAQNRRFGVALRILAVGLVNVGKLERAREIVAEARRVEPELSVSALRRRLPLDQASVVDIYCESLRKAGLPD